MANFVLAYRGGGMGSTPQEQQKLMEAWMNWFGSMGESVVDAGAPFGQSAAIASSGAVSDGGTASLSGYSIIAADGITDACNKAKGCPVLSTGGTVDVYEAMPMG